MKPNNKQLERAATKLWDIGNFHGWWQISGWTPLVTAGDFWCSSCCIRLYSQYEQLHKVEGHILEYKPIPKPTWEEAYKDDPIGREEFLALVWEVINAYHTKEVKGSSNGLLPRMS